MPLSSRRCLQTWLCLPPTSFFFFFNDTATTEIYTLSLHDALPISCPPGARCRPGAASPSGARPKHIPFLTDRKSTRLNSSHLVISYAVFCLKKKNTASGLPSPSALLSAGRDYDCPRGHAFYSADRV